MGVYTNIKVYENLSKSNANKIKNVIENVVEEEELEECEDLMCEHCSDKFDKDTFALHSEYGDWFIDLSDLPEGATHIHISRG